MPWVRTRYMNPCAMPSIAGAFCDFVGSDELSDDLTVILLRRTGQGAG